MKKMIFLMTAVLLFSLNGVDLSFIAKTGDGELDLQLNDVNKTAKMDLSTFMGEMSVDYKADKITLSDAMVKFKMEPADLYLSLEIAKITNKEPAVVMNVYSENRKEGWGAIAKRLGIKPGSKEFKTLKKKTQYRKEKHKRDQMKKEGEKGNEKPVKESKESSKSGKK